MRRNAAAALECVASFHPDVVLMDVKLPGLSGIEATREMLRLAPETAVVMLTLFEGEDLTRLALDAGASSYLLKAAPLDEILSTIRAVVPLAVV
jgi:DNA-binding NarL/FixJ family response regulator